MIRGEVPIACSLTQAQYSDRLAAVQRIGAGAVISVWQRPDGARVTLRADDMLRREIDRLIDLENECCPFMSIVPASTDDEIMLDISAPLEVAPIVQDLVARLEGDEG